MTKKKARVWSTEETMELHESTSEEDRRKIMLITSYELINQFNGVSEEIDLPDGIKKVCSYVSHRALMQGLEQHLIEHSGLTGDQMNVLNENASLLTDIWLQRAQEAEDAIKQDLGVDDLRKCDPRDVHAAFERVVEKKNAEVRKKMKEGKQ